MLKTNEIPVPDLTDPLFAPFWEGTREGRLVIQKCRKCETFRWPPRFTCRECQSMEVEWAAVEARGALYSFTIVGRATAKGFSDVPYTVGVVQLDSVPKIRIVGNVVGTETSEVSIGMQLEGRFVAAGPNSEMTLIHWAPAAATR